MKELLINVRKLAYNETVPPKTQIDLATEKGKKLAVELGANVDIVEAGTLLMDCSLGQAIKENRSLVFVNFHGLNVADETVLRRDLRNKDIKYKVSRKTLLGRALLGKAEGDVPELAGEVALAFSKDPTASAREIYNFQKTHKGLLNILGGIFEGKFVGAERMMEIATIPSREVLLSKIAFLLNSPMQRLAIAVNEAAKTKTN